MSDLKQHPIYLSKLSHSGDTNMLIILGNGTVQVVEWQYRQDRTDIIKRTAIEGNLPAQLRGFERLDTGKHVSVK